MANDEHVAKLFEKGAESWNDWRRSNPSLIPDLRNMETPGAHSWKHHDLGGVDLRKADLRGASLVGIDFSKSDLTSANLDGAYLCGTVFKSARLCKANFMHTRIYNVDFAGSDLQQSSFAGTDVRSTSFRNCNLREAGFNGMHCHGVDFREADLTGSWVVLAVFADCDFRGTLGLDAGGDMRRLSPSSIGIDTLFRSQGQISEDFLRRTGVPEQVITFMRSLVESCEPIQFYSCFISYSTKDVSFADRLYSDLQTRGVRCWFFPEDAKWGNPVWGEIDQAIRVYDKLVVICSANSLQSAPVLREIDRALEREDRERRDILFPVRIDNYVIETWSHPRRTDVIAKVLGDFRGWDQDPLKYSKSLDRLVKALGARSGERWGHGS
jgi:hypothetical protein